MPAIQHDLNSLLDTPHNARIIAELSGPGWCVTPDFIPAEFLSQLQHEAQHFWHQGAFRQAGVGQNNGYAIRNNIRTDQVLWLNPANSSASLSRYLVLLDELKQLINRTLFLGLFEYEGHVAMYPPGSYYRKHLDQFQGDDLRTVTAILYLNDNWRNTDGGQLRIYTDDDEQRYEEVLPHAGQLVTFLSSRFVHEVMPAARERLSITGWFKRRGNIM